MTWETYTSNEANPELLEMGLTAVGLGDIAVGDRHDITDKIDAPSLDVLSGPVELSFNGRKIEFVPSNQPISALVANVNGVSPSARRQSGISLKH